MAEKPDRDQKPKTSGRKALSGDAAMGEALRTVYQKTIEEQIPDEMLDLLGKLD